MNKLSYGVGFAAAAIVAASATSAFSAATTLTTVTALQQTNIMAKSYLKTFVGPANTSVSYTHLTLPTNREV